MVYGHVPYPSHIASKSHKIKCANHGKTDNFSEMPHHVASIGEQNSIISGTGSGKLPFISADDIAQVACLTLTDERPHNKEYILLGPELLSYDEVKFDYPFDPYSWIP